MTTGPLRGVCGIDKTRLPTLTRPRRVARACQSRWSMCIPTASLPGDLAWAPLRARRVRRCGRNGYVSQATSPRPASTRAARCHPQREMILILNVSARCQTRSRLPSCFLANYRYSAVRRRTPGASAPSPDTPVIVWSGITMISSPPFPAHRPACLERPRLQTIGRWGADSRHGLRPRGSDRADGFPCSVVGRVVDNRRAPRTPADAVKRRPPGR